MQRTRSLAAGPERSHQCQTYGARGASWRCTFSWRTRFSLSLRFDFRRRVSRRSPRHASTRLLTARAAPQRAREADGEEGWEGGGHQYVMRRWRAPGAGRGASSAWDDASRRASACAPVRRASYSPPRRLLGAQPQVRGRAGGAGAAFDVRRPATGAHDTVQLASRPHSPRGCHSVRAGAQSTAARTRARDGRRASRTSDAQAREDKGSLPPRLLTRSSVLGVTAA